MWTPRAEDPGFNEVKFDELASGPTWEKDLNTLVLSLCSSFSSNISERSNRGTLWVVKPE